MLILIKSNFREVLKNKNFMLVNYNKIYILI